MNFEFVIISSSAEICIYKNNQYFYKNKAYDMIWHAEIDGFVLDKSNPFYMVKWRYQDMLICIRLNDVSPSFFFDKKSQMIVCCADDGIIIFNDKKEENIKIFPKKQMGGGWYFLNLDGSINHQAVIPKYIFLKKDKFNNEYAYIPSNKFEELISKKIDIEMFGGFRFDLDNEIILGSLMYNYDWRQDRIYNPITREWGEIVGTSRV